MALSDDRIWELAEVHTKYDRNTHVVFFARAIEAEVRKQYGDELDHWKMGAGAEARRVDELTALRNDDEALMQQMLEALCECAEDSQEQLDRMEAARLRDYKPNAIAWQEDTIAKAKAAIVAGRARLEGKP